MYQTSPKELRSFSSSKWRYTSYHSLRTIISQNGKTYDSFSLHITNFTGDIILGYPFFTRFEPLIHWKERYMEITHQGYDYQMFGLPARSTISEYYPDKSIKHTPQPSIDMLQISENILSISNRLKHLQTSLAKLSLSTSSPNNTNINNNIINNNNLGSDSTLRVFESTATSSMNPSSQLRVDKKSKPTPTISKPSSILPTPSPSELTDHDRQEIEALQPPSPKAKAPLLPQLQPNVVQ